MGTLGIISGIVAVLVVLGLAFFGFKQWNESSTEQSYNSGFGTARIEFFGKGYEKGKDDGYRDGYREGRNVGVSDGKNEIRREMYDYGEKRYDVGSNDGIAIGERQGMRNAYDNTVVCLETARYPNAPNNANYKTARDCIIGLKLAVPTS